MGKHEKSKKTRTKKRKSKIVILIIILLIIAAFLYIKSRYNYEKLNLDQIGINENTNYTGNIARDKYINIALFGVDSRKNTWSGLSDSIMVLTLDYEHKEIKMTSFMRDSLVKIEGHGYEKQTHAHSYGGAQLAVKTLNTNYDLDIKHFVTINFSGMEKIVNRIGGVTVNVKKNEIDEINKYIKELNKINGGKEVEGLTKEGKQTISGRQAVAYARIRKVGNGDAARTDRQREVLEQVMEKLFKLSHTELVSLANEFMPYVKTSFTIKDIMNTASDFNTFKNAKRSEFRSPEKYVGAKVNGASVVKPDTLESNVKALYNFIYGIDDYEVSNTVKEISEEIKKK